MQDKERCGKVLSVLQNGSRPLLEMSIVRQKFSKLFKELAKRFLAPSIEGVSLCWRPRFKKNIEPIDLKDIDWINLNQLKPSGCFGKEKKIQFGIPFNDCVLKFSKVTLTQLNLNVGWSGFREHELLPSIFTFLK